ncbi:MAG: hypothetical protein AAF078_12395, partial [Planctomycetota bacterium]
GQAHTPLFARLRGQPTRFARAIAEAIGIALLPSIAAVTVVWACGGWLIGLVYGSDFAGEPWPLGLLCVAIGLLNAATIAIYGCIARGRTTPPMAAYLAGLVVTAFASAGAVPASGVDGGAWALCFGAAAVVAVALGGALWPASASPSPDQAPPPIH